MYVVPFCMGPLESPYSKFGVQVWTHFIERLSLQHAAIESMVAVADMQ
jgi:hypothetical protein